ncbi:unnamed protein product [Linum tenue]|uniref:Uncharacterized protein n=1 Tax=Linum tenue TaxID=586396 RepID=A0AAV0JIW3_9ROSI|nr:unnamed protein product [Linum tenue]
MIKSPASTWLHRSSSVKASSTTIYLGRSKSVHHHQSSSSPADGGYSRRPAGRGGNIWQALWRKINRRKRSIFRAATCTSTSAYEPEEYSMNFDQGTGWAEPDNLPRSFSARFADPSRILQRSATSTCYAR